MFLMSSIKNLIKPRLHDLRSICLFKTNINFSGISKNQYESIFIGSILIPILLKTLWTTSHENISLVQRDLENHSLVLIPCFSFFSLLGASKPLNIVTTSIQTTEASFSFGQPLHHHGDIVAYQTRCQGPGNESATEIMTMNSLSGKAVVKNLAPNRRYKCQV